MMDYRVFNVEKTDDGTIHRSVRRRPLGKLAAGNVRVEVEYSALNYKDALAAIGNPGVARTLPLVPGIDAVGRIIEGGDETLPNGSLVMIAHPDFGTSRDGGYARYTDVPRDWLFAVPAPLTSLEAITLGTAGFTAAQSVDALLKYGTQPDSGEIVVTGATGGVGIFAVMYLRKLGFSVVASTGKLDRAGDLERLGAARVVSRQEVVDESPRPLLSARWGGAVDTVGGNTLSSILRSTKPHCIVTACGLVGGNELHLTVYPFILRGIALVGIDSALIEPAARRELWAKMAGPWRLDNVESLATVITLDELDDAVQTIMRGQVFGRTVVRLL